MGRLGVCGPVGRGARGQRAARMWAAVGQECAGQDVVRPGMGQAGARQRRDGARRRASLPAVGAQWHRPAGGAAGGKQTGGGGAEGVQGGSPARSEGEQWHRRKR